MPDQESLTKLVASLIAHHVGILPDMKMVNINPEKAWTIKGGVYAAAPHAPITGWQLFVPVAQKVITAIRDADGPTIADLE